MTGGTNSDTPLVSIVLVNFRTPKMTLECLDSLHQHCRSIPTEIIVVDNGSYDDSLDRLAHAPTRPVIVPLPVNVGFGAGCNAGAQAARGTYIYLLNTDTLMEEDSVRVLADFLDTHANAVAVGSKLRHADGKVQQSALYFPTPLRVFFGGAAGQRFPALRKHVSMFLPEELLHTPRQVDWCVGASLMIRADAYRKCGGFDESFFLYAEEIDLCHRLAQYGEIWYTPETTVVHLEGASLEGEISPQRMAFMAAGRRYYYRKYYSRLGALVCNLADSGARWSKD